MRCVAPREPTRQDNALRQPSPARAGRFSCNFSAVIANVGRLELVRRAVEVRGKASRWFARKAPTCRKVMWGSRPLPEFIVVLDAINVINGRQRRFAAVIGNRSTSGCRQFGQSGLWT